MATFTNFNVTEMFQVADERLGNASLWRLLMLRALLAKPSRPFPSRAGASGRNFLDDSPEARGTFPRRTPKVPAAP